MKGYTVHTVPTKQRIRRVSYGGSVNEFLWSEPGLLEDRVTACMMHGEGGRVANLDPMVRYSARAHIFFDA